MLSWMTVGLGAVPQVLFLSVLVSQEKAGVTLSTHFTEKNSLALRVSPFHKTKLRFDTRNALKSQENLGLNTHHADSCPHFRGKRRAWHARQLEAWHTRTTSPT